MITKLDIITDDWLCLRTQVRVGGCADLLLLDHSSLQIVYVVAKGAIVKTPQWTLGGFFEKGPGITPYRPKERGRFLC